VETALGSRAEALSVLPAPGPRHAVLEIDRKPFPVAASPCVVLSGLAPAKAVLVTDHPLTRVFLDRLRREAHAPVIAVPVPASGSDIWMQDCIEVLNALPASPRHAVVPVALTGLRRRHDQGLDCAALDRAAPRALQTALPETVFLSPGNSLPNRRWIDWYGNLESTPPLPGFPHGRLLVGKQNDLEIHPELLTFLRDQEIQWPPITVDVGMLAIGHADEVATFLPADTPRGWVCAVISPRRGRQILETVVASNGGRATIPLGKGRSTTAAALLSRLATDSRARTEEQRAEDSVKALAGAMGLTENEVLEIPVLLQNGACLLPNPVNGIVLGKRYLTPDPLIPQFREDVEKQFQTTEARIVWMNSVEPFHVRGGELHCGTQVVRCLPSS
jgi:hypothetical protein